MKTTLNIFYRIPAVGIACVLMLQLYACDSFLTKTPEDQGSQTSFWSKQADAESWMYGIYNNVQAAMMGSIVLWGDARTDNLHPTQYANGVDFQLNLLVSSKDYADWSKLYAVVSACNIGIENISVMENIEENARNSYLGQCYGLRAMAYFYIVRLWGDAPLILESWDGSQETKYNGRTPVAEIAEAIEADVKESVRLLLPLPGTGNLTGVYYFNIGAAYILQADFLAWQGRYDEIPAVYDNINALRAYSLVTDPLDWNKAFSDPENSTEAVFTIGFSKDNNPTTTYSGYASTLGYSGSNPGFAVSREMYHNMVRDTLDIRLLGVISCSAVSGKLVPENAPVYDGSSGGGFNEIRQIDKIWPLGSEPGIFQKSDTEFLFEAPVYRYADIVLLYAEALNRTGDAEGAVNVINELRAARGATTFVSLADYPRQLGNSADSREKLIMDERQLEFFMEGKRWFDLLRTDWYMGVLDEHIRNLQIIRGDEVTGFTDTAHLLWPISQTVTTANPNIKQNPTY